MVTPDLFSFFLKVIMNVYEIRIKNKILNVRCINISVTLKNTNPIFEELPKYSMNNIGMAWNNK